MLVEEMGEADMKIQGTPEGQGSFTVAREETVMDNR